MRRLGRVGAMLAILIAVAGAVPARQDLPGSMARAAGRDLQLQVALTNPHPFAGGRAGLFVHTGAQAALSLNLTYADGLHYLLRGRADRYGRYVFSWQVPLGTSALGLATLSLTAQRGGLRGDWSGTVLVQAAPPAPLFVQPLARQFLAGTAMGVFVSTAPRARISYTLTADGGTLLAQGQGQADAQGRYVVTALDPLLPRKAIGVTARITVAGPLSARSGSVRFLLLPRPALGLYVASTARAVRAGTPIGVFVASAAQARISISIALTNTVVVTGTGTTDAAGRWVYSTVLAIPLTAPVIAHVTVRASHGIDQAVGQTSFLLRPGPLNLRPAVPDLLAGPSNPAPHLGAFFPQAPDKVIMISTESQTLREYDHGMLVHENYVTTGRPELPTVHGIFHVYEKVTPFQFISPWPPGSPYWYPPSWVRYWMPFYEGYGLHDAPWRSVYGPGTNLPHSSDPGEPLGSHGCVNIPLPDMVWLWNWADVGTTVVVY